MNRAPRTSSRDQRLTPEEWFRISCEIKNNAIVIPDLYHRVYYWWGITWKESFQSIPYLESRPQAELAENELALPKIHRFLLDCLRSLVILQGIPLNPPPFVHDPDQMERIRFPHNQLVILDALYRSGGEAQYDDTANRKMVYSEHSGALDIHDQKVVQILVFATPGRIEPSDDAIIMPANVSEMKKYPYLFHTHPNTGDHMARYHQGVPYELPSPGDLSHFSHYAGLGTMQGSIIISPEGMYIMRRANWCAPVDLSGLTQKSLAGIIHAIQKRAIQRLRRIEKKLVNLDAFHKYVASDSFAINQLNDALSGANIFVDYYPRIRQGSAWVLPEVKLNYEQPKWLGSSE